MAPRSFAWILMMALCTTCVSAAHGEGLDEVGAKIDRLLATELGRSLTCAEQNLSGACSSQKQCRKSLQDFMNLAAKPKDCDTAFWWRSRIGRSKGIRRCMRGLNSQIFYETFAWAKGHYDEDPSCKERHEWFKKKQDPDKRWREMRDR